MDNINVVFRNLESRNQLLPKELKDLKFELQICFEKNILQAGVINPGYFSYFLPVLERYKNSNIITKYHLSEEQYTNGLTGNLIKVPVVDVFTNPEFPSLNRIFITSESFFNLQK